MKLYKISLLNIKKSFKDYAIYFFTLILGVAVFYVFNAIESQTVMLNISSSTAQIIELMVTILSGISVFIAFILGFLIIYASRFLLKRRNKEFGVYMTLGMSKSTISKLLLTETFFIGLISLVVGLVLGFLLSQVMSIFVANMFEAKMTSFTFTFSLSSMIKTIFYFTIIYLIVMLFNTILISKCKLIDLIQANKKSEKIKMKNPILCIIVFIISAIGLGYAYYLVTAGIDLLDTSNKLFIPIGIGVITTFLIVWSLSGLILKIVSSMKGIYYKDLNSFILRQISSKINTTVVSMTIICLMLFTTICALSSAVSMKNAMTANLKELVPVDIQIQKKMNLIMEEDSGNWVQNSKTTIQEDLDSIDFSVDEYFKNSIDFSIYSSADITNHVTLGSTADDALKKYPNLALGFKEQLIKISDYNKIAKLYHNQTYTLKDNEYMIIADYEAMLPIRNDALKKQVILTINGKEYMPKYKECKDGFIEMSTNHITTGIILVPDTTDFSNFDITNNLIANYKTNKNTSKTDIENLINNVSKQLFNQQYLLSINTKIDIYESAIGLGAMVTFIGLYLGIIFLMTSAAILALKELSESNDNKERYQMLRKLGADEKLIHKALFRQIAIFFLFPLLFAIIHSIFGIKFCNYILETFGDMHLLTSILMTTILIVFIYGGYFLITYFSSKQIIKENK